MRRAQMAHHGCRRPALMTLSVYASSEAYTSNDFLLHHWPLPFCGWHALPLPFGGYYADLIFHCHGISCRCICHCLSLSEGDEVPMDILGSHACHFAARHVVRRPRGIHSCRKCTRLEQHIASHLACIHTRHMCRRSWVG